jgi:Uma2 family endonuclease
MSAPLSRVDDPWGLNAAGPLTYDDLQRLREGRHERLELIDGELFVTPSPSRLHQLVSKRLIRLLLHTVDDAGVGDFYDAPFDVKLGEGDVVQPDLVVVLRQNFAIFTDAAIEGVPDLVIEIVSPSTRRDDRVTKRDLYARYEVSEYWLVDPDSGRVTVFAAPQDGRYRNETVATDIAVSLVVPGLATDLTDLFSPVPEA